MSESPRIRDQKALTTSTGRGWLVLGAILTALCGGMLAAMWNLEPAGVGVVGALIVVAEYAAMIVVRLKTRRGRPRLITMAALAASQPVTFFVCAGIVTFAERAVGRS